MKYKIKSLITTNDIVPNMLETYPPKALLAQTKNEFYNCLVDNKCNILCYHITRLTSQEKKNVRERGLSFGGKKLLINKVENLPHCCDWFKMELLYHIQKLYKTKADNLICASYGYLDLDNDPACDNIFHSNWGGESIYDYYDNGDSFKNKHLRKIHETLLKISFPCILVLRVDIATFYEAELYSLFDRVKEHRKKEEISGSLYIENVLPELVEIIDLNTYDGIDFT